MYNPVRVHKEIIKTAHKNKLLQQEQKEQKEQQEIAEISWWQQILDLIRFKWVLPPFG